MFNRKTRRTLIVLLALCAIFTTANTTDAIKITSSCWKSICAPPGASTHIDQNGCMVTSICLAVEYCEIKVCPGGNNDGGGGNS